MNKKALSLLLLGTSSCLLPFAVPPAKVDVSGGANLSRTTSDSALHVNAGLSLNAAQLDPYSPLDLQVGYALHAPANSALSQGAYGAISWFAPASNVFRGELGLRGEVLANSAGNTTIGSFLRLGGELFHAGTGPFASDSSDGFIVGQAYGTGGFSFFADIGRLNGAGVEAATYLGLGVGIRIPAAVGLFFGCPY